MSDEIYIYGDPQAPEFPECHEHRDYFEIWGKPDADHPAPRGLLKVFPYFLGLKELDKLYKPREMMQRHHAFVAYARVWLLADLYAFQRFCLSHGDRWHDDHGMLWLDHPWLYSKVRELDRRDRLGALHKAWLYWFRGGWKTSEMQALCTRWILQDPNIRIMYYSRTHPMAQKRARGIRRELEQNRLIHLLWPEIVWGPSPLEAGATVWGEESFAVKRQERAGLAMSEPTLGTSGIISGLKTGDHVDKNVFDDIEDDDNAHTEVMVEKTVRNVRAALKITDASSALRRQDIYSCTQYSRHGPMAKLKAEGAIRTVWVESAVDWSKPNPDYDKPTDDNPDALDIGGHEPVILTASALKELRGKGEGPWKDYCLQMLCRLKMAETRALDSNRPQLYTEPPHHVAQVGSIYVLGDPGGFAGPSSSEAKISDSVLLAVTLCADGFIRLVDAEIDIMTGPQRISVAHRMAEKWRSYGHLVEVRLEEGGTGNDCAHLAELQVRRNFLYRVVRITRGGGYGQLNKVERIYKLVEPLLDKLCLPKGMIRTRRKARIDVGQFFRQVLDEYPATDNANPLDALALINEPPDKSVTVFQGSRYWDEDLGLLQWPSGEYKLRRRGRGPTMGHVLAGEDGNVAAAFGVSGISQDTFMRRSVA